MKIICPHCNKEEMTVYHVDETKKKISFNGEWGNRV